MNNIKYNDDEYFLLNNYAQESKKSLSKINKKNITKMENNNSNFKQVLIMSREIINILDKKYKKYLDNDCIDVVQLKNFCYIYINKDEYISSKINLSEVEISSPIFTKTKISSDFINDDEFKKKYKFFIKILYCCFQIDVEIFDFVKGNKKTNDFLIIKNNYQLLKSILKRKQDLLDEHIDILKIQKKDISVFLDAQSYKEYCTNFISKIEILDTISKYIDKIVYEDVLMKSDNLFSLLLTYFHVQREYIEEYGC